MKKISAVVISTIFICYGAMGGTAVGNFSFKTQIEFDFRIAFPPNWSEKPGVITEPGEIERWVLTNSVQDPLHRSSAELSFLSSFPANNDQELLLEIKKRHPSLNWLAIQNPDFSVGFVSDQVSVGSSRTENFEYFFSSKGKVVRIIAIRDAVSNGATELDTILSMIRRPSLPPEIVAIRALPASNLGIKLGQGKGAAGNPNPGVLGSIDVGQQFCYQIELSLIRSDFNSDSLQSFEVRGALPHWSFKTVSWHQDESALHVCLKPNAHSSRDGLVISELSLTSTNGKDLSCHDVSLPGSASLACGSGKSNAIQYQVPEVNNPSPVTEGPLVTAFTNTQKSNVLHVAIDSGLPLSSGEISLVSDSNERKPDSQVLYKDQLVGRNFDVTYDFKGLKPGFSRVGSLALIDEVGNVSVLKIARPGDTTYTRFTQNHPAQKTKIGVVSLLGGGN